jgi:hypothetical protein
MATYSDRKCRKFLFVLIIYMNGWLVVFLCTYALIKDQYILVYLITSPRDTLDCVQDDICKTSLSSRVADKLCQSLACKPSR